MYEGIFNLRQRDKSLAEYYNQFKGMIVEPIEYHSHTDNLETARRQLGELYCKFLSEFCTSLQPLSGQLLTGERGIMDLHNVFS